MRTVRSSIRVVRRFAVPRRRLDRLHGRHAVDDAAEAVYCPSSAVDVPVQMKNDVVALSGSSPRAIETIPFTCFVSLNSGARLWTSFCCFSVSGADAADERAGLNDEAGRDAMKGHAVVDAGGGEPQELPDGFGRLVGKNSIVIGPALVSSTARYAPSSCARFGDERLGRRVANRDVPDLDALGRQRPRRRPASPKSSAAPPCRPTRARTRVYWPSSAG